VVVYGFGKLFFSLQQFFYLLFNLFFSLSMFFIPASSLRDISSAVAIFERRSKTRVFRMSISLSDSNPSIFADSSFIFSAI